MHFVPRKVLSIDPRIVSSTLHLLNAHNWVIDSIKTCAASLGIWCGYFSLERGVDLLSASCSKGGTIDISHRHS